MVLIGMITCEEMRGKMDYSVVRVTIFYATRALNSVGNYRSDILDLETDKKELIWKI